jgi:hypothetical protein
MSRTNEVVNKQVRDRLLNCIGGVVAGVANPAEYTSTLGLRKVPIKYVKDAMHEIMMVLPSCRTWSVNTIYAYINNHFMNIVKEFFDNGVFLRILMRFNSIENTDAVSISVSSQEEYNLKVNFGRLDI